MKATLTRWRNSMGESNIPDTRIPSATVDKPLTRRAQELRDAHYSEWAEAIEQRDAALERVKASEELCAKATMNIKLLAQENEELKRRISDLTVEHKGRVISYQLERDEAVAKHAKLEAILASIRFTLDGHFGKFSNPEVLADNRGMQVGTQVREFEPKAKVRGGYQAPEGGTKPKAPTTGSGVMHDHVK